MKNNKKAPHSLLSFFIELMKKLMVITIVCQLATPTTFVYADDDDDDYIEELQEECDADSNKEWNSSTNTCVTSSEAEEAKEQSDACMDDDDPTSCYISNAESLTNVSAGDSGDDKNNAETIGQLVAGAYTIFLLIAYAARVDNNTSDPNVTCTSKKIMAATSLAWIVGDLYLKSTSTKSFEELSDQYQEEVNNEALKGTESGSYQAQVRAFEYLKAEQEQVKEAAGKRKMLQMVAAVGFAASLGFAIKEMITQESTTCTPVPKTEEQISAQQEVDSGEQSTLTNANDDTTSNASDNASGQGSITELAFKFLDKLGILQNIGTSGMNAIAAGIMLGLNAYLIYHASNEEKKAEENIENIDEVLSAYEDYMSGFCPDGRDDISDPDCYCYNDDGSENENRTNSAICQNLFAANSVDYSSQTAAAEDDGTVEGCVTVTGQYDSSCKCANMTNTTTGANACATVSTLSTSASGFANSLGLSTGLDSANALTNGSSTALASLDSAALSSSAAKNKKIALSMLEDAKKKGQNLPSANQLSKMATEGAKSVGSKSSGAASTGLVSSGNSSSRPEAVKAALEDAKESKAAGSAAGKLLSSMKGGSGVIGATAKKKGYNFVWNEEAASSGGKIETFMDKKYKYKNSDINNRKDVSIWSVISNRYQTSGLKRLFSESE